MIEHRNGNPWPAPSVAVCFAVRVCSILVARNPELALSARRRSADQLIALVDIRTGARVGFDAYHGLTGPRGEQIFDWSWLLGLDPVDAAGEIDSHWLPLRGGVVSVGGTGPTSLVLNALAVLVAAGDLMGSSGVHLETASVYNARGGDDGVDVILESLLDELEQWAAADADPAGPIERAWIMWHNGRFACAVDVAGRLHVEELGPIDLMEIYHRRRSVLDVAGVISAHLGPRSEPDEWDVVMDGWGDVFDDWRGVFKDWLTTDLTQARHKPPERARVLALWRPDDPRLTELEIMALSASDTGDWSSDWLVGLQLRALQGRALAAQGRFDEADALLTDAFSGFIEAPPWIPMLQALEEGRVLAYRASAARETMPEADLDDLWTDAAERLAECLRIAPGGGDLELAIEAAHALAALQTTADGPGFTGLWADFGSALAQRAPTGTRERWLAAFAAL